MANAIAGVGTTFERWSGSAWQFIAEINAIEGPTMDKENIEVTALDTDGGYDEFITGFMEGGTLTLNMNFSRSGYELMKQDFEIDVARDYRITLPDDEDTTLEFEGLVIEIPLTMEAEDKLTADVTIQVTGEVAIASAGAESSDEEVPVSSDEETYLDVLNDGNTLAWFASDDEATLSLDSENYVEEWASKIGTRKLVAVDSDPCRPLLTGGVVQFDGVENAMVASGSISQPATFYLIMKQLSYTVGDIMFAGSGSTANIRLSQHDGTPKIYLYAGSANNTFNNQLSVGTWGVVRMVANGKSSSIQVDTGTPTTGDIGAQNSGAFYLGASYPSADRKWAHFEIKELIIRSGVDSSEDQALLYAYLAARKP